MTRSDFPGEKLRLPFHHTASVPLGCGFLNPTLTSQGGASQSGRDRAGCSGHADWAGRDAQKLKRKRDFWEETLSFLWAPSRQGPPAVLLLGGFQTPAPKEADLRNGERVQIALSDFFRAPSQAVPTGR